MDDKEMLSKVGTVLTDAPIKVTVKIKPKNFIEKFLIKRGIKKGEHEFEISPAVVDTAYLIASRAQKIPESTDGHTSFRDEMQKLLVDHREDYLYIIATAFQNNGKEPSKELINLIGQQFTFKDLFTVLNAIFYQFDEPGFLNSTRLIKGMDILTIKGGLEAGEIIAPGEE